LDSVDSQLGSKDYWRVRIGIDNRTVDDRLQITPSDFVLKQLSKEELRLLERPFDDAILRIREIIKNNGSTIVE
jgi:peptidyl-tRNA hydrolase